MGSLNLNSLKNTKKNPLLEYVYKDLHLDIVQDVNVKADGTKNRDIRVDYDENAIINSIKNIFLTSKGERFLVPDFGCNLYKYLFEVVSESVGYSIGKEIERAINIWEPRVYVNTILVVAKPDQNEYEITIDFNIPFLNRKTKISEVLKAQSQYNF